MGGKLAKVSLFLYFLGQGSTAHTVYIFRIHNSFSYWNWNNVRDCMGLVLKSLQHSELNHSVFKSCSKIFFANNQLIRNYLTNNARSMFVWSSIHFVPFLTMLAEWPLYTCIGVYFGKQEKKKKTSYLLWYRTELNIKADSKRVGEN